MKGLKYIVLLANAVIFALLAWLLPLGFEENDDVMMAMIANGTYSGTPDYHLVYINALYGMVLAGLYAWTKAIEWYTLSFAVLHVLSMSVLSYCLLTIHNRARWERVVWLVILYVLWARIIVAMQFTTTAGLVCLAGCVLLLRLGAKARWAGAGMVIIAALVRFLAAGLVGLLMAPIIVYTYRLEWRKYIAVVVMLVAVVGCRLTNQYRYDRDPEWKYYRAYNLLRAQLNDNPNAYRLQPNHLPENVNWMDYQLLLRFVPDGEQIDLPAIRQLSAVAGTAPLKEQWKNVHRLNKYAVEVTILMALLVLMILTTGNKTKYMFLILYTLFVAGLLVHVSLDGFLKNRVFLCMLMPLLVTDFILLPNTTELKRRWGIGLAIGVLSAWYCYQIAQEVTVANHNRYEWEHLQQPVLAHVPDGALVTTIGTTMLIEAMNPWHIWPYPFGKYTLGWMTWSPLNKPVGHSYRALLRDDMYIFTQVESYQRDKTALRRICEQIEAHYGVPAEIQPKCYNSRYALVKLKVKS